MLVSEIHFVVKMLDEAETKISLNKDEDTCDSKAKHSTFDLKSDAFTVEKLESDECQGLYHLQQLSVQNLSHLLCQRQGCTHFCPHCTK